MLTVDKYRLRDGKLEQGVLKEAASRLQQKIQKHLLDSEDGKVLEDLVEKGDPMLNLDSMGAPGDKTVSVEFQVKMPLSPFKMLNILCIIQHEEGVKKGTVTIEMDEQVADINIVGIMEDILVGYINNPPYVQMRGIRTALVCPQETSDVEVNYFSQRM